jgi:DNA-binding LacI/PurR family transcriptional regulator
MTDLAPTAASDAPPSTDRSPVMADVARLAGVSHQTVSRVINGQNNIRPETRERVERAIRQLGYRPNTAARALVTRRSGTIGVIGTAGGYWGPSTVHRTIQAAGRESGYFVSSVNLQRVTLQDLSDAVEHLRGQAVEGIVLIAANQEALEVARAQETGGVPMVVVEGDLSRTRWAVGVDQFAGARLATEHLIDLGHEAIAHVAGPMDWTEARARAQGWQSAMYEAGLRPSLHLIGDWSARSGYHAGVQLATRPEVTGIFAANDQMAIGVLRALAEAGREVPREVSVVGFDDIPEAEYLVPPLTTVRQDFTAVGHRAIEVLRRAIQHADADDDTLARLIDPELIVRTSTAPRTGRTV